MITCIYVNNYVDIVGHFLNHRTVNRGPAFAARASVINRASGPSIVVTCGRTKLPPSKTIYIHRRRGWRIVSALCRSEADLVGDRAGDQPGDSCGGSHLLQNNSYLPFSRDARIRGSAFQGFVSDTAGGHHRLRGLNNYHTRNEVFIVGQRSFESSDERSGTVGLLSARLLLFFWRPRRSRNRVRSKCTSKDFT